MFLFYFRLCPQILIFFRMFFHFFINHSVKRTDIPVISKQICKFHFLFARHIYIYGNMHRCTSCTAGINISFFNHADKIIFIISFLPTYLHNALVPHLQIILTFLCFGIKSNKVTVYGLLYLCVDIFFKLTVFHTAEFNCFGIHR